MDSLIQIVDCLHKKECELILRSLDENIFHISTIFGEKSLITNTDFRSSTSVSLKEESKEATILHTSINKSLLTYKEIITRENNIFNYYPVPGGIGVNCYREPIQILRYQKGQKYGFHHDTADDKNIKEYYRTISVIVYLNDNFIGGETEFINGKIKPRQGQAIIFPSSWSYPHMGQEVKQGKKFVAVTWYYSNQH